ncbi:MAG: uracil-DNA glycosylase family protein [Chakrabartia sp.]
MTGTDPQYEARLLAAALRWWEDMGVDTLVEDEAQPWLGRAAPAQHSDILANPGPVPDPVSTSRPAVAAPPVAPMAAPLALPETLEALQLWLAETPDLPEAGPPHQRLASFGTAGARIAIVTDMPEAGDAAAGQLLSGAVGTLFDAMLKAIGLDRSQVYCFALCPGRPPTGRLGDESLGALGKIARHHLALAGAERVWALGQATSRALIGVDATASLDKFSQNINHFRGNVPCIASLHPRLLLQAPQRKALVWKDMQMLIGDMN